MYRLWGKLGIASLNPANCCVYKVQQPTLLLKTTNPCGQQVLIYNNDGITGLHVYTTGPKRLPRLYKVCTPVTHPFSFFHSIGIDSAACMRRARLHCAFVMSLDTVTTWSWNLSSWSVSSSRAYEGTNHASSMNRVDNMAGQFSWSLYNTRSYP